jgi:hypothetical protein
MLYCRRVGSVTKLQRQSYLSLRHLDVLQLLTRCGSTDRSPLTPFRLEPEIGSCFNAKRGPGGSALTHLMVPIGDRNVARPSGYHRDSDLVRAFPSRWGNRGSHPQLLVGCLRGSESSKRPIANRPQDAILPHRMPSCPTGCHPAPHGSSAATKTRPLRAGLPAQRNSTLARAYSSTSGDQRLGSVPESYPSPMILRREERRDESRRRRHECPRHGGWQCLVVSGSLIGGCEGGQGSYSRTSSVSSP